MNQPQSPEEIQSFVSRLREMVNDPSLDIRWNPKAVMIAKGSYTVMGQRTDPTYDGRWEIIRYDDPRHGHTGFHEERGYVVICAVTEPRQDDGIWYMVPLRDGGAYAPIGEWTLEMMRQSDMQNVEQFRRLRDKLWAQHERAEERLNRIDDGAVREALDHNHFQANFTGGVGNWQGKGADFKDMEARATQRAVKNILSTTSPASR